MIKCNLCWKKFESQEVSYITSCCHIFCDDCANKQFSKERICPSCDQSVTSRGGISRNILAITPDKTVQLCGLTPKERVMSVCGKALEFWNYQVQVAFDYERADLGQTQAKMTQLENAYGEKLEESYSKMTSLKRQLESVLRETETYKQQIVELEEKYSEKSRQKRKLEELYDSLKAKYEHASGAGALSHAHSRNIGTFAVQEDTTPIKPRFARLSPGPSRTASPKVQAPNRNVEDRFIFRKSPVKVLEKPTPSIPQSTPSFASPKRPLFRSVKIPDSPRFSRFGKGLT